jgi:osmoprotectant transport system permease protein
MDLLIKTYIYTLEHSEQLQELTVQHLQLVSVPLGIGILLGIPLGWLSSRFKIAGTMIINLFSGLRVIPSLAILFVAVPYFGLSFTTAVIALTLLVIPPILISTDAGFRSIAPELREVATGMGMSPWRQLYHLEIPLAFPVILAGIKTAAVEAIASATLAAFVGAGGLGDFILLGFSLYEPSVLLVGAIPVALLALGAEVVLSLLVWLGKRRTV